MRPSLRHQLGERRRTRRTRGAHRADPATETHAATPKALPATPEAGSTPQEVYAAMREADLAAQRVREAGGPSDLATYACECGYLFAAAVTTTVGCPHCGIHQAW